MNVILVRGLPFCDKRSKELVENIRKKDIETKDIQQNRFQSKEEQSYS